MRKKILSQKPPSKQCASMIPKDKKFQIKQSMGNEQEIKKPKFQKTDENKEKDKNSKGKGTGVQHSNDQKPQAKEEEEKQQ